MLWGMQRKISHLTERSRPVLRSRSKLLHKGKWTKSQQDRQRQQPCLRESKHCSAQVGQFWWWSLGSTKSTDHQIRPRWWSRYEAKQHVKSVVWMWNAKEHSQPHAESQPHSANAQHPQCRDCSQKKGKADVWGFLPKMVSDSCAMSESLPWAQSTKLCTGSAQNHRITEC